MKKTLWTLSAIALIGLGAYACGDDECDPAECAQGQECIANALGETVCGWPCDSDCAAEGKECVRIGSLKQCMAPCDEGQTRGTDGLCISGTVKDECTTKAECEENQDCINGVCTDLEDGGEKVYKYVRIDDLTDTSKATNLEDAGADIDTIILLKGGTGSPIYPSEVAYYLRADGKNAKESGQASDPDIVKSLTSFTKYPNTDECLYKNNGEFTFASLGGTDAQGKVGTLIVEMGASIEAGDKIDVLEVGDCKLTGTEKDDGSKAIADTVKVSISVGDELGGTWQVVVASGKTQKGIISANIDASMVPAVK